MNYGNWGMGRFGESTQKKSDEMQSNAHSISVGDKFEFFFDNIFSIENDIGFN